MEAHVIKVRFICARIRGLSVEMAMISDDHIIILYIHRHNIERCLETSCQ